MPPDMTACTIDSGASGSARDMQQPGAHRDDPADREPPGAEQASRAAQRMPHADRRGKHRPAMLEQEGDVGRQCGRERKKQSEDHESRVAAARPRPS